MKTKAKWSILLFALLTLIIAAFLILRQPIMTEAALSNLSYVGSVLIFCVGVNLVWGKKVKVANMLPAVVIAVAWSFFG